MERLTVQAVARAWSNSISTPELHLRDGRIIRHLEDALAFAHEQEMRPGVDQHDEVLHKIERAQTREEAHAAAHGFLQWLEEIEAV